MMIGLNFHLFPPICLRNYVDTSSTSFSDPPRSRNSDWDINWVEFSNWPIDG